MTIVSVWILKIDKQNEEHENNWKKKKNYFRWCKIERTLLR